MKIKLVNLVKETQESFDERKYDSMLYQAERPLLKDKEALDAIIKIYKSHINSLQALRNDLDKG